MAKTYSLKGKVPYEVARAIAEELVKALPDTVGPQNRVLREILDVSALGRKLREP